MTLAEVFEQRLRQQCLTGTAHRAPADVVRWMGAVQAQEYLASKWGLAQRMTGSVTDAAIEGAVNRGEILRTHVMRPTWHFVTPADIRWMLALTGPRVVKTITPYYRFHGLEPKLVVRALSLFARALEGGRVMTRPALGAELATSGIRFKGIALALLTIHAESEGILCNGPYQGKQLTYALLDERVPKTPPLSRDEAVAEIVTRFFQSHGPATLRDFAWWSGLTMGDGRRGLDIVHGKHTEVNGLTCWTIGRARSRRTSTTSIHLLPIYDEFTVAYRDRPWGNQTSSKVRGQSGRSVTFQHALIIDGQVAGTWRTARKAASVAVEVTALRRLTNAEREGVAAAARRFGRFLQTEVALTL